MTQLTIKNKIDDSQLNILLYLLKSWNLEAEVSEAENAATEKQHQLFSETFGMWADRSIDIRDIRKKIREKRTKSYGNAAL
jgi:hypothetical protein